MESFQVIVLAVVALISFASILTSKMTQVTANPPLSVLLNPVAWLLWTLDFLIWCLTIVGPIKFFTSFTEPAGSAKVGDAWRLADAEDSLQTSPKNDEGRPLKTVHECVQRAFKKYADRPAAGTRTFLGEHKPEWSKFPLAKFGETKWLTYKEMGEKVNGFGAGLLQLGLKPAPAGVDLQTVNGPHSILIFEETCVDWAITCMGAFTQSIAVATSYSTLGMNSVAEALNETGATAIVCNIKDVEKIAKFCDGKTASLETIIYTTNRSLETKCSAQGGKFKVISLEEVIAMGKSSGEIKFNPPSPDHLAVVMYTSGSTGKPKGVMIKHKHFTASIAAIMHKFKSFGLKEGEETYLAYLPAAHILELVAEVGNFCMGSAVGFACPKTISSKGACRVMPNGEINTKPEYPHPPGAIQEFRPTSMAAVPKIWDILKKGVEEVVGKGSPVKKFLFQVAYTGRYWALNQGRESPLFKALVFKKLKTMLGGRLVIGLSGGGPISGDVQTFIRTAFATPLIQGYALTETACAGTVQMGNDMRCGVVGPPVGSVEIKLRSCLGADGAAEVMDRKMSPYLSTDKNHYGTPCLGRGEVMIRGPSVSAGYYKQKEKTDEVFDGDGWFHSGDVGLWTTDGALMIVDRLKNLVKLKGGEYVAIESMEKEYSTSVYVNGIAGGIMCYGDGDMDRPVAFCQVNTVELENWAKSTNVTFSSVEELCKSPAAEKCVLDSLVAAGKKGELGANEIICAVALIPGNGSPNELTESSPWTPENGGLTASNKLNRKPIEVACDKMKAKLKKAAIR